MTLHSMAHNGIRPEGLQSFCSGAVTHPSSCLLAPAADSLQRYPDASCLRHHVYGHTIVRLDPFVKAILQMNLRRKKGRNFCQLLNDKPSPSPSFQNRDIPPRSLLQEAVQHIHHIFGAIGMHIAAGSGHSASHLGIS